MKSRIYTSDAPAPIGPYSQAVKAGPWIFVSGQIPLDPKTGKIETEPAQAARLVMRHIENILKAAGTDWQGVVKTTIFLQDLRHFDTVNRIYAEYFTDGIPPARETVQAARLPKDVPLEISVIALSP